MFIFFLLNSYVLPQHGFNQLISTNKIIARYLKCVRNKLDIKGRGVGKFKIQNQNTLVSERIYCPLSTVLYKTIVKFKKLVKTFRELWINPRIQRNSFCRFRIALYIFFFMIRYIPHRLQTLPL